jgi:Rieske Fe-S protein
MVPRMQPEATPDRRKVAAFSAIRTHQGCRVSPQGRAAQAPLEAVPVKLSGQDVVAG